MTVDLPVRTVSILFALLIALLWIILYRAQRAPNDFDLKDVLCETIDGKHEVSTTKTLLTGAFLISSYLAIVHPSDVAYAAYLTAWVSTQGVAAWKNVQLTKIGSDK